MPRLQLATGSVCACRAFRFALASELILGARCFHATDDKARTPGAGTAYLDAYPRGFPSHGHEVHQVQSSLGATKCAPRQRGAVVRPT